VQNCPSISRLHLEQCFMASEPGILRRRSMPDNDRGPNPILRI
jgi:hypothetical protein